MLCTLPVILQDQLEIIPSEHINLPHSFDFTLLILIGKIFIIQDSNGIKSVCEAIVLIAFHAHPTQLCGENTLAQALFKQQGTISFHVILRDEKQYPREF